MLKILAWPAFKNINANPYNWLLYTHVARFGVDVRECSPLRLLIGRYSILHVHWPDAYLNIPDKREAWLKTSAVLNLLKWARLRGTKIVWTIHNIKPHEGFHPDLERSFMENFINQIDGYISLSKAGLIIAQEKFPALKRKIGFDIPHGHYRGFYPNDIPGDKAREYLGLSKEEKVMLFFGQIRPYKNVTHLIKVFRQLDDKRTKLIIAGKVIFQGLKEEIFREVNGDNRVILKLDFIPDDHLQIYLKAADLVVFPYREILNSGSALLALSFDKPIIVPEMGALGELRDMVGASWVYTYKGELRVEILKDALTWAINCDRESKAPIDFLDWTNIARETIELYTAITNKK